MGVKSVLGVAGRIKASGPATAAAKRGAGHAFQVIHPGSPIREPPDQVLGEMGNFDLHHAEARTAPEEDPDGDNRAAHPVHHLLAYLFAPGQCFGEESCRQEPSLPHPGMR